MATVKTASIGAANILKQQGKSPEEIGGILGSATAGGIQAILNAENERLAGRGGPAGLPGQNTGDFRTSDIISELNQSGFGASSLQSELDAIEEAKQKSAEVLRGRFEEEKGRIERRGAAEIGATKFTGAIGGGSGVSGLGADTARGGVIALQTEAINRGIKEAEKAMNAALVANDIALFEKRRAIKNDFEDRLFKLKSLEFQERQTQLEEGRFGLEQKRFGLEEARFDESQRQFDLGFTLDVKKQQAQEQQFAQNFGLDEDQFSFLKDKFQIEFGLDELQFNELIRHNLETEAVSNFNARTGRAGLTDILEVEGGFAEYDPVSGTLKRIGTQEIVSELKTIDFNGQQITGQEDALARLSAANDLMQQATGQSIIVGSHFRSGEEQQRLFDELSPTGARVAPAGQSFHEKGMAFDIVNWQEAEPFLKAQGLVNDLPDDRGHFSSGETNVFDPILPRTDDVPDSQQLNATELKSFGVPAGTTWGDVKTARLVPGSITNKEALNTLEGIEKGLGDMLVSLERIDPKFKGKVQGRIADFLKFKEGEPTIATFEAQRAIIGMMLTRLFEKGRISDQDRLFYMSQMPNLNQTSESALASAESLKVLLRQRIIENPLEPGFQVNTQIENLSPEQRTQLENEGLL